MAKKVNKPKKRIFNLLKPVETPKTSWDKVYDWIVGNARIVIFVVEILIIVAFVAKFIVDTQAKNKDQEIEALRQEEQFYAQGREGTFAQLQTKSRKYVTLWNNSSNKYSILSEVYSYLPTTIDQIDISIDTERVILRGYEDLNELKKVEASFKNSPTFSDAQIEDLTLESDDVALDKGRYSLVGIISDTAKSRRDL